MIMKIYWHEGKKNIIGNNVFILRKKSKMTQKELSEKLQLAGYDFDRLTVGRIESGDRFVADYEVKALAEVFYISINDLFT
jgi:transcriptional regulator with XRE-family HTH domain